MSFDGIAERIEVVAFDADDTLWIHEPFFWEAEKKFCDLLAAYVPQHAVARELLAMEMTNVKIYGYGVKSYTLSMIETALTISDRKVDIRVIEQIIEYGKELLQHPLDLVDGIEEVLQQLASRYRLVVATKGDLLDQTRKLTRSGLENYFHHIEVVCEKEAPDYARLIGHLDIQPEQFLMVGNSLKSDILPVLEVGGFGAHVPAETTWAMDNIEAQVDNDRFVELASVKELLDIL